MTDTIMLEKKTKRNQTLKNNISLKLIIKKKILI